MFFARTHRSNPNKKIEMPRGNFAYKTKKCLTFHVVDFWIWWTDFIINVRFDSISAHPLFNHVEMPNGFVCSEKNIAIHVGVFSVDRLCVPFNRKAKINGFIYKKVYF